ncbi:MAG: hypothetical protein HWN68_16675 [Desulfobacterales bacterium]|nr:hypothetical protein [Desulfobacterales bacterium]
METMQLVITLRKPVADRDEGLEDYEAIKQKMLDRTDFEIAGHVANHFEGVERLPE